MLIINYITQLIIRCRSRLIIRSKAIQRFQQYQINEKRKNKFYKTLFFLLYFTPKFRKMTATSDKVLSTAAINELVTANPSKTYISIQENIYDVTEFLDEVLYFASYFDPSIISWVS